MTNKIDTRKVNYIFLLCLFSLDYLYNNAFNVILTRDVLLVLFLFLVALGFVMFNNTNRSPLYNFKNTRFVYWTWGLVLISSFIPVINGVQGYLATLLAQRSLLAMLFLILLLKISPSEDEMIMVFKRLTIITIILGLLSIKWPYLFMNDIQTETYESQIITGSTDIINTAIGLKVLLLYYFYMCQNAINNGNIKNITIISVLLVYLIIVQSRSSLLIALPVYVYTILKMNSKHKFIIWSAIGVVSLVFFFSFASEIFDSLYEETQSQLTNEGYNRWQALDFFFFEREYGMVDILFGHGVPSADSSYLKELVDASESRWAFISDIGMLGVFFYYGALFLSVFYFPFVFIVLFKKKYPVYLKAFSLWVLFVPTIHCYNLPGSTSFVIYYIFMYLVIVYKRDMLNLQSYSYGCVYNNC